MSERASTSLFISYSHDSPEHASRVRALAERLGAEGFHCIFDQYVASPPEGWPRWMDKQMRDADFVLSICTETYYRRVMGDEAAGLGLGVRWEGNLIYQYLYEAGTLNTRFVPILLAGSVFAHIPKPLQNASHFNPDTEDGFAALSRRLRGQAPALRPTPSRPDAMVWLVALGRNHFFRGRAEVLEALRERFSSGAGLDIQAVYGLGGVGKSQVAAEYAYVNRASYDAVLWSAADTESALVLGYSRIAEALGLPELPDRDQSRMVEAVTRWMQTNARWLLVLDNVEDPALLARFLPRIGRGHVLLTSRLRLLDAASVAAPIQLLEMSAAEALAFLLERTKRSGCSESEVQAATEIVSELGGLPLALEQAGAYVLATETRFDEYLRSYRQERLALLENAGPVQGAYQGSVATTWRMNFRAVEKKKASAELLYLSALLHPDNIPLELITAGAEDFGEHLSAALQKRPGVGLNEVLEPLSRYSLIRRDVAARTYNIHRLVQDVLRAELGPQRCQRLMASVLCGLLRAFPTPEALYTHWVNADGLVPQVQAAASFLEHAPREGITLLSHAGFYLGACGRYSAAESLLERALEAAEQSLPDDRLPLARALARRGWLYFQQHELSDAEQSYGRALHILEATLGPECLELAEIWNNLATVYDAQARFDEAEALYLRSIAMREQALGKEDHLVGLTLMNLGLLYEHRERFAEAIECGQRAQSILERWMGKSHPIVATNLDNMGWLHFRMQRYPVALALLRRSVAIREQVLGPTHPDLARGLTNLAIVRSETGDHDVEALFERALQIRQATLPPDHRDVAFSLGNLGELYAHLGRYADAEALYERAVVVGERAFGPMHLALAGFLEQYAGVLRRLDQAEAAAKAEQRAKTIRHRLAPVGHQRTAPERRTRPPAPA